MKFERHQDPKDAIGVGLKANAPTIETLLLEDITLDSSGLYRKILHPVDHKDIPLVLRDIESGEIPANQYHFDIELPGGGAGKLHHLVSYAGKYVKYINNKSISVYDHPDKPILLTFFIPNQDEF